MSYSEGHGFELDCACSECEKQRAVNRAEWARLSEPERNRRIAILADQFEEAMMEAVGEGKAEIVGHNENGRTLFRFKDGR